MYRKSIMVVAVLVMIICWAEGCTCRSPIASVSLQTTEGPYAYLQVTAVTSDAIGLSWQVSTTDIVEIRVLRQSGAATALCCLGTLRGHKTEFQDTEIQSGCHYWYLLQLITADGATVSSNIVEAKVPGRSR